MDVKENKRPDSDSHIEDGGEHKRALEGLKLDPHGLPLVPQPSRFKDDPLVSAPLSAQPRDPVRDGKACLLTTDRPFLFV